MAKKELMLLCVQICILPCKTFDPVQSKPPTEQNERLLKVHECDWENILSFSQVILSVPALLGEMIRLRIQPSVSEQPPFEGLLVILSSCLCHFKNRKRPWKLRVFQRKNKARRTRGVLVCANGIFRTLPTQLSHYSNACTLFFLLNHSFEICYKKSIFS